MENIENKDSDKAILTWKATYSMLLELCGNGNIQKGT